MPELTPTGAVDTVRRQVRRIRWRKNFYELQRTLYLTIAAAAVAATVLLPLALFAPEPVFARAAWTALAMLAVVALLLARAVRHRWLEQGAALGWIEKRGALAGRLRTLIELDPRPASSKGFFFPLLAAEIGRDLERWAPRRMVPRRVPRATLAGALAATGALLLAWRFASTSAPLAPDVTYSTEPVAGRSAASPAEIEAADRVVVAPGASVEGDGRQSGSGGAAGEGSALARLPNELQERIRQQVWGKAWERVRDALARATETSATGTPATREAFGEEAPADDSEEWEIARVPSGALTRRRRPGVDHQPSPATDDAAGSEAGGAKARDDSREAEADGGAAGGAGAGNDGAPELFGAPSDADTGPANGSFELALAARIRAKRSTDRRAGGEAPAAEADAHPELAADQRHETAAHRMAVPPAYETVVREVFAHRRAEVAGDEP